MAKPPNLSYGDVPTAAQWNLFFSTKQDSLGYVPVNRAGDTMFGKLNMLASSTVAAGINITPGTAPNAPKDGDLWSTNTGFYGQVAGDTVGPFRAGGVSGPNVAVANNVATFADVTGGVIKDSGVALGSAASHSASDFASAAEGAKADTALQPTTGLAISQTVDQIPSITVPATSSIVTPQGFHAVGDDGDMQLTRVGSVPTSPIYAVDAGGAVFAYLKRTIKISQAGGQPSPTVSQHQAFINALAHIQALGGGCVEIDQAGIYAIGTTISLANPSVIIRIENTGGGVLKALSSLANPVMSIGNPAGTTPSAAKLFTDNLIIDNSQGQYVSGASSCEGLHLIYLDQVILNNYQCIGGFDPNAGGTPTTGGDTGLGTIGCRAVIANNPIISGQPDTALYPNWDNSGTIDGYFEVNNPVLFKNNFCMTAKRNLAQAIVRGGHAHDNLGGFSVQEITSSGNVDVCRYMELDGILIERTLANVAVWRDGAKGKIHDCTIRDIGYLPNGTGGVGTSAIAVYLLGASEISSHNNVFEMVQWAPQGEYAYRQDNSTFNAATYTGGAIDGKGNTYRNWSRHTAVTNVGAKGDDLQATFENLGSSNRFSANFATQGNLVSYFDLATTRNQVYISGVTYALDAGRVADPITVDLTSLGTLAAGSQTSTQSLSITGITTGDEATLSRVTSSIAATPALIWSWRVTPGAVQYIFRNIGGSTFDFTSQSMQVTVRRP